MLKPIDLYVIKKVREKRRERGLTQSQLAYALEQSPSFIKKVESGNEGKKYNVNHLYEIALILKCSISDFFPKGKLPEK